MNACVHYSIAGHMDWKSKIIFNNSNIIFIGIIASNGLPWLHDRRFVLRNLRDLGMGKSYLEEAIQFEAQEIVKEIKSLGEKPMIPPKGLQTAVFNIIWQMVASKRYDLQSTEVDDIFNILDKMQKQHTVYLEIFFPVLRNLPRSFKNKFLGGQALMNYRQGLRKIISVS